ncbi:MAG: flagellar hook basal-body protein [Proteobacteria bacterium]|nr:flagellar hook basal-body protein [Pseudomonadota bacterium]
MGSELYIGVSGAVARLRELDVVANNLANAQTTGFKRDGTLFDAVLQSALDRSDGSRVAGAAARSFVSPERPYTDWTPAGAERTGASTDVAIEGPGFFEVLTPDGPRYTRHGAFHVNAEGTLATADGYAVLGEGGPIEVGAAAIEIAPTGEVRDASGAILGRLRVVEFEDLSILQKQGGSLVAAEGEPTGVLPPRLIPESLESSNVDTTKEMAALVVLQRSFAAAMETIRADDRITARLLQEVTQ